MDTIKTFTIHGQEVKNGKQKFIAFSAYINEQWFKVKFTKDCNDVPKVKGLFDLTVDLMNCSFENGKTYEAKNGELRPANHIIWVRKIDKVRQYTEAELAERNLIVMQSVFGE